MIRRDRCWSGVDSHLNPAHNFLKPFRGATTISTTKLAWSGFGCPVAMLNGFHNTICVGMPDCANAAPPFPRTSMLDLPIMQENLDIIISISSLMFASRGTRSECLDQKIIDRHFLLFFANSTLNNDNQPVLDIFKFNQVLDEIGVLN